MSIGLAQNLRVALIVSVSVAIGCLQRKATGKPQPPSKVKRTAELK
jgi:hypothetical protein